LVVAADGAAVDSVVCSEYERGGVELEDRGARLDVGRRELEACVGDVESGVAAVLLASWLCKLATTSGK
jgi:hypothetical protein